MKDQGDNMPLVNQRIRLLVDNLYKGSVRAFCMAIGYSGSQKVNRLFKIDKRNGQYPKASINILITISNKLDISLSWLITGEGEILRNTSSYTPTGIPTQKDEWKRRYDSLNAEYMEIFKELRESYKDIMELHQQLDKVRDAKLAADARITHLETLLAIKKATEHLNPDSIRLFSTKEYSVHQLNKADKNAIDGDSSIKDNPNALICNWNMNEKHNQFDIEQYAYNKSRLIEDIKDVCDYISEVPLITVECDSKTEEYEITLNDTRYVLSISLREIHNE